ncbi:GNAT family N-acetyltransferase [Thiomicrorhabdus sp.]|uniref:GNAT family N-acetyltransferase n=1 Tax=Thiomicrorhabdus sp. TaxID=2039724 RepID=UPI0029C6D0FB|nr:GNAT family N-acetyltransferase [Thiomicrorhabdus sp.]
MSVRYFSINASAGDDTFRLKHFLKAYKQRAFQRRDRVFTAEDRNYLISFARLVPIDEGGYWLRGLFVIPEMRRLGIASHLVDTLLKEVKQEEKARIYLFAREFLTDFYLAKGFTILEPNDLPESLQATYEQAISHGKHWTAMKWSVYSPLSSNSLTPPSS